ncbi:MAG: zinc metalloprotease HtpX [Candidatus Omnitrophica bacterium]|nr:zinc metalloprotease HtpX [Candidatus Omnitrophota bacterium]
MMNTLKTAFFLTLLTLLFIAIGGLLGGRSGMVMAFGFALLMNFVSYWFSDRIVLAMYRAKPCSEAEAPELVGAVRRLSELAQMPMPKVYIIPTEAPNAFATGRSPAHAAVAATQGILRILNEEELTAVLAHEISHVRNRDVLIGTIAAAVAGAIYMLADMARWSMMWGGGRDREGRSSGALQMVLMLFAVVVAPIAAMLVQMAISRSREYQADQSGAELSRKPLALASALQKIHAMARKVPMEANPATAHLFIVNPLSAQGLVHLFSTHPPVERRVEILEGLARRL